MYTHCINSVDGRSCIDCLLQLLLHATTGTEVQKWSPSILRNIISIINKNIWTGTILLSCDQCSNPMLSKWKPHMHILHESTVSYNYDTFDIPSIVSYIQLCTADIPSLDML